ncbi:MAG: SpoIID/LytB domain-containing protein [Candidatus Zixiibacteriota bacterium]|nr:MAG: SpoIID/LytB domain-containing protein [candidate division Zixibacteria bacterium]
MKFAVRFTVGIVILVLVWSCASIPGLREESAGTYIRVPFVRVLVGEDADRVTVSTDGAFAIECIRDGQQSVYYSGQPVTVTSHYDLLTVRDRTKNEIESRLSEINIIPRGRNNRVKLNGKRYRGILRILPDGQSIRMVNIVYMEDYLRGVVPPEIGERTADELEAVKAQAVAARTYAMAHLQQYGNEPFDMKSSVYDQIYDGVDVEDRLVDKAIEATAGRVIMYQDQFITAYYHSTCGGRTDNIADVWDKKEVPYLKSVEDGAACSWSKYYTWKEVFTEEQLRGRIEQYLSSDRGRDIRIGSITDVSIRQRTAGGRVARLVVRTDLDNFRFHKDRIRWVIGRASTPDLILPSDRFDVTINRDSEGNVTTVEFSGRGYGHGVGMCQCGAIGAARDGWTFDQILSHYYTGVEIEQLY